MLTFPEWINVANVMSSFFSRWKLLNTLQNSKLHLIITFQHLHSEAESFKNINLHRKDTSKMMQVRRNDINIWILDFHPSTIALSIDFMDVYQKFFLDWPGCHIIWEQIYIIIPIVLFLLSTKPFISFKY